VCSAAAPISLTTEAILLSKLPHSQRDKALVTETPGVSGTENPMFAVTLLSLKKEYAPTPFAE